MPDLPIISVILSAYNAENFIGKSIKSVLNQTFKNFEFLIIDDCSTDNTLKIIREIAETDERIIVINNTINEFVIESRNKGILKAKGKYIAIIDADDIWFENKLEKQFVDIENDESIFLLSANAYEIDENDNRIGKVIRPHNIEESNRMILQENPFCHPSILFKNEGYLYRPKMFYTEEYDLYLRLFSDKKKMIHRKEFLFNYRILSTSLSRNNKAVIQALFKQKAISFYYERVQNKIDNYDSFNPEDYLNIFDLNYDSSIEDLKLAMKLAFISNLKADFIKLVEKSKKQYSIKLFLNFWVISKTFNLSYKIYSKK
jgi:glycosyltransferase involved in cell wall biosynthesis